MTFKQNNNVRVTSLANRFWAKVDRTRGYGPRGDCWEWDGSRQRNGYGRFRIGPRVYAAHRIAFDLANPNKTLGDLDALHHCDNPPCCNPGHLFSGTQTENNQDRDRKGRQRGPRGERHGNSKLTAGHVNEIRRLWGRGWSQLELADRYAVSRQNIYYIVHNQSWKHLLYGM